MRALRRVLGRGVWRGGVAGLLVALVLVGVAVPARATSFGGTNCAQQPDTASCTTKAGTNGNQPPPANLRGGCRNVDGTPVPCFIPGKGWYSASDGCYYQPATPAQVPGPAAAGRQWFAGICGDPTIGFANDFTFFSQFQTAPGPATLAQQAIAMLRLPTPAIGMSPAPGAPQVVRVPAWLWVAGSSWGPRAATASAGGVSVEATATPKSLAWSTGDGATITCQGPGTVWSPRFDPATASPTCGHTYLRPSPQSAGDSQGYVVRATVTWSVTWAGAGMRGAAPPLTSTATTVVRVVQSTAVNTLGLNTMGLNTVSGTSAAPGPRQALGGRG